MSKTCDRCGKKLNERDRTTICLECEVALADEVNHDLRAENAALLARAEAAEKERDAAVEDMTDIYKNDCDICRICANDDSRGDAKFYFPDTVSEICKECFESSNEKNIFCNFDWHSPKDGEKGEEG